MNDSFRTPSRRRVPIPQPWVPPFDGVPARSLDMLVVGRLPDLAVPRPIQPDPGVVVATGGLTDSALGTVRRLRAFFPRPIPIVLVLGPEEFRDSEREATLRQARRLASTSGVTLLDDAEAVIRGVRFVGGTLWTDFRLHGTDDATVKTALDAAASVFDRLDIRRDGRRLTPLASTGLHWRSRSWLGLALPGDMPTIVVTHHAPTGAELPSSPCIDPLAASRASRCDDLVRQSAAALWVHGGCDAVDHVVGGTRVVSCPVSGSMPIIVAVAPEADDGSELGGRSWPASRNRCHTEPSTVIASPPAPAEASLLTVRGVRGSDQLMPRSRVVPPTARPDTPPSRVIPV